MKEPTVFEAPQHLAAEPGVAGALVRAAAAHRASPAEQGAAFERLLERATAGRRRGWRVPVLAFAIAAACALAIVVGLNFRQFGVQTSVSREPRGQVSPIAREFTLPQGETELYDGTRVRVENQASARVEKAPAGSRISLESGVVTLEVAKQAQGRTLEVSARGHRFVVLGTVFSVSASAANVVLDVREGRVAVFREQTKIAEVGAGESWSNETTAKTEQPLPRPASLPMESSVPAPERTALRSAQPEAPAVTEKNCLALARERRPRDAERCFTHQAAGAGLGAEMALLELSRLRSDVLGDPAGALSALKDYRTRFPGGSLQAEVDISYLHLLARLGRHGELLTESARVLNSAKGRERGAELRMLRANTYRTGMKDFASAEREYAEVERTGGRFAGEAGFYRGVCLQALGNTAAAKAAYQRYLEVPGRPRRAEARRRLDELGP